jgi:hypothetical protein
MLPYANTLLRATSPEHMDYLMGTVKKGIKIRQTLESAGLATQFAAELFDPVNYIGIPFVKAGSFGYRALRGGTATGAVVAGQEAIRDPFDPVGLVPLLLWVDLFQVLQPFLCNAAFKLRLMQKQN